VRTFLAIAFPSIALPLPSGLFSFATQVHVSLIALYSNALIAGTLDNEKLRLTIDRTYQRYVV
jgi:hypothetical protein